MVDPRLNSIHLEAQPRRQDFRRAREKLLGARGQQTLAAEQGKAYPGNLAQPPTLIRTNEAAAPSSVKFLLVDKDYIYPLKVGLNTIGRMPDNDVVIQDACISRRHCAILVHAADGCELHDVASKNGTFINGQRLTGPTRLSSGDEICMCNRQFIFMTKEEGADEPDDPATDHTRFM